MNKEEVRNLLSERLIFSDERVCVWAFGGLHEVGKICFGFTDYKTGETLLIEAGMIVPRGKQEMVEEMIINPRFLPQFDPIIELASKGRMHFGATHGHLDHMGGYPALWSILKPEAPIFCSRMTADIISRHFRNYPIEEPKFGLLDDTHPPLCRHRLELGPFDCEFFAVPHSVPQTRSIVIEVNGVKILFMSDFKWADCFAYPGITQALGDYLKEEAPFDLVLYEALYPDREGLTPSEDTIREPLRQAMASAPSNIIGTWFASNLTRYMLVEQECSKYGLTLFPAGRTMLELTSLAIDRGWLTSPATLEITDRSFIASTGNQAEGMFLEDLAEMACLVKAAKNLGELNLFPDDSVAFLTHPIPGNEPEVKALIVALLGRCPDGLVFVTPAMRDELDLGAYEQVTPIPGLHASGHGFRGDHEKLLDITKPKIAIPYHVPPDKVEKAIRIGI